MTLEKKTIISHKTCRISFPFQCTDAPTLTFFLFLSNNSIVFFRYPFLFYQCLINRKKNIDTRLTKAWTAFYKLSIIWKSDLIDKMKRRFFKQRSYRYCYMECTTWTLTKRQEKKIDGNYTRMLRAILNKSWRQHPTKQQLYGHLPPITKTIQVRRTRNAGHCWRSRTSSYVMYSYGPPHMAEQKLDDQVKPTYSSSVRIRDVALETCQRRWTIGRSGEREGQGYPCLATWHDDIYIYIYKFHHTSFSFSLLFLIYIYILYNIYISET